MRRLLVSGCLAIWLIVPGHAAEFVAYESITVAATAIGISATVLDKATFGQTNACAGRLETAQVRYRFDGTNPTSSEGQLLEIGDQILISNYPDAVRLRLIRTGATSGVLKIHCWRDR